jgi:fatty acid desaturase
VPKASPTPTTFDASSIDLDAFYAELKELRRGIDTSLGEEDIRHLRKFDRIGKLATAIGLATCWIAPNPLSIAALSLGRSTRWMLMHHVGHRGYDKVPGVPAKYTSKVFARGRRRFLDWNDWMIPEAWIYEHNVLHHSNTGEDRDPDLVERNTTAYRASKLPLAIKYAGMAFVAATWRLTYYAPNTLRAWLGRHDETAGHESEEEKTLRTKDEEARYNRAFWSRCVAPYTAIHFALLPGMFLPLGPWAAASALANSLGAEALTNVHTFAVVGPNHSGDDLYRFTTRPTSKAEGMLRQVIGSVNYPCGNDTLDYAHLWLNYQIEHHIWPDLPMLRYQEVQPKVKALCEKHGIPYVQESVWKRVRKMLSIAVGTSSMKTVTGIVRRVDERPTDLATDVAAE